MSDLTFKSHNNDSSYNKTIAELIAEDISYYLTKQEQVVLLASGGNSPGKILEHLSGIDIDWSRVIVSITDERLVNYNHPERNSKLIQKTLLKKKASQAKFVHLAPPNISELDSYLSTLNKQMSVHLPFDVAIVGMGLDGHTASIFPNYIENYDNNDNQIFLKITPEPLPENAPWGRVSCSMATLSTIKSIHLLMFGIEKLHMFKKIISSGNIELPIANLVSGAKQNITVHTRT